MSEQLTQADFNRWYELQKQLASVKAEEMTLRKKIASVLFPSPIEGTNKLALEGGYVAKLTQPVTRTVDVAVYNANIQRFKEIGIALEMLVDWDPKLKVGVYKALPEEQRAIFDDCVTSKFGSPGLEIVAPKP